ncbi:MAG: hypothetical protein Q9218_006106 [Villophora microphyllina]
MIEIDPRGDLVIKVVQFDDTVVVPRGEEQPTLCEEEFQISKDVARQHSKVLGRLINRHYEQMQENKRFEPFTLKGDTITSMEILLRSIHGVLGDMDRNVFLEQMWHLTAAADKYAIDIDESLTDWFEDWYLAQQDVNAAIPGQAQKLLFPCWRFNHAEGFQEASHTVIYGSQGPVMERNPTKQYEQRLPQRVIQQLNAAKGRLRTILHAKIWELIDEILNSSCSLKEKTMFGYIKALTATRAFPLDPIWPKWEVTRVLAHLRSFSYESPKCTDQYCRCHRRNFDGAIIKACNIVAGYCDGLCLDCMNKSMPKTADYDTDYWLHNDLDEDDWDRECRVSHDEPTWYFSFMGRREDRDNFIAARREKRRAERRRDEE